MTLRLTGTLVVAGLGVLAAQLARVVTPPALTVEYAAGPEDVPAAGPRQGGQAGGSCLAGADRTRTGRPGDAFRAGPGLFEVPSGYTELRGGLLGSLKNARVTSG